eukprot:3706204-Rhodomonas_salina.1
MKEQKTQKEQKPQKEPQWRVVIRHPDGRDVRVEWRSDELDAAKLMLEERIGKAHWLDGGLFNDSLHMDDEGSGGEQ